jgi:hypothetical protein
MKRSLLAVMGMLMVVSAVAGCGSRTTIVKEKEIQEVPVVHHEVERSPDRVDVYHHS